MHSHDPHNIAKNTLAIPLTVAMILITGFLAFTGALYLTFLGPAIIPIAILAFALSGIIEGGEVYRQNIISFLKNCFTKDHLQNAITSKYFDKVLATENEFSKMYRAQSEVIKRLQAPFERELLRLKKERENLLKNSKDKKILQANKLAIQQIELKYKNDEVLKQANKKLLSMKRFCFRVLNNTASELDKGNKFYSTIPQNSEKPAKIIALEIQRKTRLRYLGRAITLLAGVSYAFAGIMLAEVSIQSFLLYFHLALLSGLSLTIPVFFVATLGAVGFGIGIYMAIDDIIINDTLQTLFKDIKAYYLNKPLHIQFGIVAGVIIVSGLAAFLTFATGGTLYFAAKYGTKFIPYLSKFGVIISAISAAAVGIGSFFFNLSNSLDSVKILMNRSFKSWFSHIIDTFTNFAKNKNTAQRFDIFFYIYATLDHLFGFLVYMGHLASMGLTGNNIGFSIPVIIPTTINIIGDGLVDVKFLVSHGAEEVHGAHNPAEYHHHHHDHSHGAIFITSLIITSPFRLLSLAWQIAGNLTNKPENRVNIGVLFKEAFPFSKQAKESCAHNEETMEDIAAPADSIIKDLKHWDYFRIENKLIKYQKQLPEIKQSEFAQAQSKSTDAEGVFNSVQFFATFKPAQSDMKKFETLYDKIQSMADNPPATTMRNV